MARARTHRTASPNQLTLDDWAEAAGDRPNVRQAAPPRRKRQATPEDDTAAETQEAAPDAGPTLLTTHEAAALLHVHPRTVQRLVERGEVSAVRLGWAVRFDPRDIARLIERVKSNGGATAPPLVPQPSRRRGSVSFAERLRSQRNEHRAAHA